MPRSDDSLLVHAPYGRDASLIAQVVNRAGVETILCPTIEQLCAAIQTGAGAALISDQSLTRANVAAIASVLKDQPPWSDFPLIVTTSGGEATADSRKRLDLLGPLGNASLIERPLRKATLISAVQSALRGRRRQYQLRDIYLERENLIRELGRSNGELSDFAHVVSHDLQAPIRTVKIFSQLLGDRYKANEDPATAEVIATIQNGAATMETLIRTLLNYATLGHAQMNLVDTDLGSAVAAAESALKPAIDELAAEVSYHDLPLVVCDPVLLQQVLQNLIGNALKYCEPARAPRIHVSAQQVADRWIICVKDNGPGIGAEYHARIFQPLRRLHGDDVPGTGMGLAVCRKIVVRHGGEMWVESEIGQGAAFYFTLPKQAHADGTPAVRTQSTPAV